MARPSRLRCLPRRRAPVAMRRRGSHCFSRVAASGRLSVTVRAWPNATLNSPGSRLPHERTVGQPAHRPLADGTPRRGAAARAASNTTRGSLPPSDRVSLSRPETPRITTT
jgi:hypothetical protein